MFGGDLSIFQPSTFWGSILANVAGLKGILRTLGFAGQIRIRDFYYLVSAYPELLLTKPTLNLHQVLGSRLTIQTRWTGYPRRMPRTWRDMASVLSTSGRGFS